MRTFQRFLASPCVGLSSFKEGPVLYYPMDTALVSEWPGDRGGWWHYGTDFAVPIGTPLRASFDGVVVFAGGDGASGSINGVVANGEGLTVDIQRSDGLIARYGHLSSIQVRVGARVTAGQIICHSGNTGFTTGPHCHWELRWDRAWTGGAWADPRNLGARQIGELIMDAEAKAAFAAINKRLDVLGAKVDKTPARTLAYKIPRRGKLANGKPRTGNESLKSALATWLHQTGITRRTVEATDARTVAIEKGVAANSKAIAALPGAPVTPPVPPVVKPETPSKG